MALPSETVGKAPERSLRARFGLDRAVLATIAMRMSQALASIVLLYFVARRLSPDQQGYYYTFNSLVGLQIVFELGLAYVLAQYASHECALLQREDDGRFVGDERSKARLSALLRFAIRWYAAAAGLLLVGLVPAGIVFFSLKGGAREAGLWLGPWLILVFSTALTLLLNSIMALLEGAGEVAEVAQVRLVKTLATISVGVLVLVLGGGLYSLSAMACLETILLAEFVLRRRGHILGDLWHAASPLHPVRWGAEIWPFQWKIGLSWLSGYFIAQVLTPILFNSTGKAAAGQMGMTMSAVNGLQSIPLAWISTKAPLFGRLVALGDRRELDRSFLKATKIALILVAALGTLFCAVVAVGQNAGVPFAERFLPPLPLALLLIAMLVQGLTFAQATYLRAHKQEPFLVLSLAAGALTTGLALWAAPRFGVLGVATIFCAVAVFIGGGWGTLIFVQKRQEYGLDAPRGGAS